jgi:hypothetical protein
MIASDVLMNRINQNYKFIIKVMELIMAVNSYQYFF